MMKHLFLQEFFLLLLTTTTIVISEDNIINDQVALLVDDNQPLTNNITCFCTEDEICDSNTRTCQISEPHNACYESWTLEMSDGSITVTAGCIRNDYFFARLMCGVNQTNRIIVCCSQRNHCNDLDAYSKEIRQVLTSSVTSTARHRSNGFSTLILIIIISTIVALLLLTGGIFIYIKQQNFKKTKSKPTDYDEHKKKNLLQRLFKCFYICKRLKSTSTGDTPSGQPSTPADETIGPGVPLLIDRTLARQIILEEIIGAGRYGSVHRGKWREDYVAVKIFSATDERSWFREIDIYQTVCLRHENILGYIAADNMDASTHTQLWLVTEYHENGSVYDYLMNHTISVPILLKMMLSIASGLCHLHLEINSTNGKVALAHRDLKTKNILVKKDLSCCIADLGLAVKEVQKERKGLLNTHHEYTVIDIQENSRVGTQRYMAPEVLDGTLNKRSFESFKAADIYALGLVYWEILRRCRINPTENDADPYQVPYEDVLPNNPTNDQMRDVVCTRKIRPSPSPRWQNNPILSSIVNLCEELWIEDPTCRLNSLNIKRQLKRQLELLENDLSNINIESQQQSIQNNGPWTA